MVHLIRWLSIKNLPVFVFLIFLGLGGRSGIHGPTCLCPYTATQMSYALAVVEVLERNMKWFTFNVNLAAKKIVYEPLFWSHLGVLQSKGWVELEGPTMD